MTEPVFTSVRYYAHTEPERPRERPAGIMRVLRGPKALAEQAMWRDGRWHDTEYFIRLRHHGEEDEGVVEISVDEAAVILHRWRETGVIPVVEGVDIPPPPATDEPAPAPGPVRQHTATPLDGTGS